MDATERQTFGEQVREHRLRAGLTQEELAERAGLSPRGLVYLERDERRPQPGTARRLADALELEREERRSFLDAARGRPPSVTDAPPSSGLGTPAADETRVARGAAAVAVRDDTPLPAPRRASLPRRAVAAALSLPVRYRLITQAAVLAALAAGILATRSLNADFGASGDIASTPARPVVLGTWGTRITGPLPFHHMWNLAVLPNGRVAVIENYENTGTIGLGVAEFSPAGDLLWSWASTTPSQVAASGIAGDAAGNVYVAVPDLERIDKFSPDGKLVASWGPGLGLMQPRRVAVDRQGNIWVVDTGAAHLLKLSPTGRLLASYGSAGSRIGQFVSPFGVAIGRNGDIYTLDMEEDRITELSPQGTVIRVWGSIGNGPGQLNTSRGLATDAAGNVYVADSSNQRVEEFSPTGRFLATWGRQGHGPGQFMYPVGVGIAPNGDIVVADDASSQYCACGSDRIEVFSPSHTFLYQWTYQTSAHPTLSSVAGLAVDARGDVYATDPTTGRIVAFGPNHLPIASWAAVLSGSPEHSSGPRKGRAPSRTPAGIAVDHAGRILIADLQDSQVRRYTTHGTLLGRWGSAGRLSKYIPYPKGLAVDARGDVFLADTQTQTVDEFNAAGKLLERWYNLAPPNGAIATDSAGHVYLGNQASATVDMYSPGGHYMGSVGGPGRAVGSLQSIAALAVDSHGRVYVVDSDARAVSVLSPSGTLIARWTASRFPAFGHPRAITLDRGGNIYIGGDRQIVEVAALH